MRLTTGFMLVGALLCTVPVAAQEQAMDGMEQPSVLMISYYQCPQSAIADIAENYDTYIRPVEENVVEAGGGLASAGLFFHWWADEWNVNYYRMGWDVSDMLDAVASVNQQVGEANPELQDQAGPFDACTAHKDGIYQIGPGTGRSAPQDGGN